MKRNRLELSKNLLQMKFMQRTKENVERELDEQKITKFVDQELLDLCRTEGDRYMTTNSFIYCQDLRYGRMSYKGMNSEIEKLMQSKEAAKSGSNDVDDNEDNDDKTNAEFSNNEMAKAFKRFKSQNKNSFH